MAKYDVTRELAEVIKSTRIQNNISSKAVALHIGKSPSYMTKLESANIKTIDESELTSIFKFIFNSDDDFQQFLNTQLSEILKTLEMRFTDEEIDEQLWFYNYDTVLRMIPIPATLVQELNTLMEGLNVSVDMLCSRINANEGIRPQVTNADAYPFNEWQAFVVNHQISFSFIKMKVEPSEIMEILTETRKSANYVTLQAMVYYLLKIKKHGNIVDIGEDEKPLMAETRDLLNSHKFFSISEKRLLSNQAKSKADFENLLTAFDRENIALINDILAAFQASSNLDLAKTNEFLKSFVKNLQWDTGFMMRIISLCFYDGSNLSFNSKQQMLYEIRDIAKKYADLCDTKNNIEVYD